MAKKGFVFYYDWVEQLSALPPQKFVEVVKAILAYHRDGISPPSISPLADMAMGFIVPQIDRMKEKGKNGLQGGRPRKSSVNNDNEDSSCPY